MSIRCQNKNTGKKPEGDLLRKSLKINKQLQKKREDLTAVNLCDWISEQWKAPDSISDFLFLNTFVHGGSEVALKHGGGGGVDLKLDTLIK